MQDENIDEQRSVIAALRASEQRLREAQELAHVGNYDWEIATDTNTWSDELYRIYGHEPQSFNASYERFLELIHPDDRERIKAIHWQAMQDHQPYRMEERIIRPDGEMRILESTGRVICDDDGNPVRMVGVCLDVTERRQATEEMRKSMHRFAELVQSAPDAVFVVSAHATVEQANAQAERLLACTSEELVGRPISAMFPGLNVRGSAQLSLDAVKGDGSLEAVDVTCSSIDTGEGTVHVVFARSALPRLQAEEARMRLHDADEARRHALQINDNVVQGLTSLVFSLELGDAVSALKAARGTLESARSLMSGLLDTSRSPELEPGDLVRNQPAPSLLHSATEPVTAEPARVRVVIADDAADLRFLVRVSIAMDSRFEIVGEAADGAAAVEQVTTQRPDVIVLDLAMPVMDGLEAITEIRKVSPDTRILVLSGFQQSRLKTTALAKGAHGYLEKGAAPSELIAAISRVLEVAEAS